jgi:hypothetical protein
MDDIDWLSLFNSVCSDKEGLLNWSLPEPWVQAELYSQLREQEPTSQWHVISHEVPYATYFPVVAPKKRDLVTQGAIKWVDLALVSEERKQWCWFELKVRHTGKPSRRQMSDKAAMTAIKQDVAALVGMDVQLTVEAWARPDGYTASHWFDEVLKPRAGTLQHYSHSYVMAYLQLFGGIDCDRISEGVISQQVEKWVAKKNVKAGKTIACPPLTIEVHSQKVSGGHSLVLVRWAG